jgi:hypothetical protein
MVNNLQVNAGEAPIASRRPLGLSTGEILAAERSKIIGMLNDLADLKLFAGGAQRRRLEEIEQALRVALLENDWEDRQSGGPAAVSDA